MWTYEREITERVPRLGKRFNRKVVDTNTLPLKRKNDNYHNDAKKKAPETQGVVYKVNCLECSSIYSDEIGRKLEWK